LQTKSYIKKAFKLQLEGAGYTFVEILSNCNTNWKMPPVEANRFILEEVVKTFPLGVFKG
jgi:2-oxoglutarate ferredoxin oxidoreductase subunit beta